ncbi:MAG: hypothetical protein HRU36_05630 [Rickettsiales bacterium]|nr:hypothetical protein [Rickettsiales bacterium]
MFEFLQKILRNTPESIKSKLAFWLGKITFKEAIFFVFKIFRYWYSYITLVSIIVVYYLFKALEETGILDAIQNTLTYAFNTIILIAEQCFPLIVNLPEMFDCIKGA